MANADMDAMDIDMVVDITTVGRKTGQPRRIEIWAHLLDGAIILAASPGRRSWYANMVANPERVTLHPKNQAGMADLSVRARPILDESGRRDTFSRLLAQSAFRQGQGLDVEAWTRGSKLVELIPA